MSFLNGILDKILYGQTDGDAEDSYDRSEEFDEDDEEDIERPYGNRRFQRYNKSVENSEDGPSSDQRRGNVVQLPTPNHPSNSIIICMPEQYEEAQKICGHLKDRSSVLVNLEKADKEVAQRIVDFVSGTVFAIDGDIQKVSKDIFAASPSNVDLVAMKKDVRERSRFAFYR